MSISFNRVNKWIVINAPQTVVTIQDLINTVRNYEDDIENLDLPKIANCSGKQDIGGGVLVGLTIELLDGWKIRFEDRAGPAYTTCYVTGGNLAQISGAYPIEPSAYVFVVVSSSSSATIAELQIANLQRLIETQRESHTGTGNIWYWDPAQGNDGLAGNSPTAPVKTFAKAHSLAKDYGHDIIICQPGSDIGDTYTNENLVVTKNYLFIRGPGTGFHIQPTSSAPSILVSGAYGVELDSLFVHSYPGNNAIEVVNSSFLLAKDLLVPYPGKHGMCFTNVTGSKIDNVQVRNPTLDAFHLKQGCVELDFKNIQGHGSLSGSGMFLSGSSNSQNKIRGKGINFSNNAQYGLRISGAINTLIDIDGTLSENGIDDILDEGTNTNYSGIDKFVAFGGAVNMDVIGGTTGITYPRGTFSHPVNNIADAKAIAEKMKLKVINVNGGGVPIILSQDLSGYSLRGVSSVQSDLLIINGHSINGSTFERLGVVGQMTGTAIFQQCVLMNMYNIDGYAIDCGFSGTLQLSGTGKSFASISSLVLDNVTFDLVGTDHKMNLAQISGDVTIKNVSAGCDIEMSFNGGQITIDPSCTSGSIQIDGLAQVYNYGTSTLIGHAVNNSSVADAVWDEQIVPAHTGSGTAGEYLYGAGGGSSPTAIADAVWNTSLVGHTGSNTFGEKVGKKLLTFAKWFALNK